jgi:Glutathione synthase/Ribosomal protein S6 modification enzyme (glutaminyl transferase)
MDSLAGYTSDDELAIAPLNDLGWDVETVSWRDETTDWNAFELVVVRTPWDYHNDPKAFLAVLRKIDGSNARLENPFSLMEWNLDKRYLRELEARGTKIVPTIWSNSGISEKAFSDWQAVFDSEELIIKPTVSATAKDTFRSRSFDAGLTEIFAHRSFMVQPFINSVVDEGEFSLFYFSGEYSHAISKSPKRGDFRVQEEHGGLILAVEPEQKLRETADEIVTELEPMLYARVDLVRDGSGDFMLMELELIEPALYFRMNADSPRRFAAALDRLMS